ncbi:hypothetical protein FNF27_07690 [Cafeteria roenbergensis]|uniref:Uncharacterized protein n=1 Tax=Cafeteria roenbergensis TaxID=33653 RepID=A0A5A8DJ92_CAFRO|nr:hypothetical protein FNF27_07690 [Cafeteria roenbergensis]
MAFFGITSKGPQNPFRAATEALARAGRLALFSKADIEAAFRASCRSSTIGQDEADEFLVQLYHGPAPAMHEKRLKDRMLEAVGGDYSGRLDLEQLLEGTPAGGSWSRPDAEAAGKEIRPKRKCAETKFAERLLKAGELL